MTIQQAYNNAINKGITTKQIIHTKDGIEILPYAFANQQWTNKTIPTHIHNLLPFITHIGEYAFCLSNLNILELPKVIQIHKNAFMCSQMTYLYLPIVEFLGYGTFVSNNLTSIYLPYLKQMDKLCFGATSFVVFYAPNLIK